MFIDCVEGKYCFVVCLTCSDHSGTLFFVCLTSVFIDCVEGKYCCVVVFGLFNLHFIAFIDCV